MPSSSTTLPMNISEERFLKLERQVTANGHALSTLQPSFPSGGSHMVHRKLALPIPLASYAIGATTWLLGLLVLHVRNITEINFWIVTGIPMGSILTILCGMGEFFTGNTFGCALFSAVGGIIFGLSMPFLPWSGIQTAFAQTVGGNQEETLKLVNASGGIYLEVIFVPLLMLLIAAQKTALVFVWNLTMIIIVVITLGISNMTGSESCLVVSGIFLLLTTAGLFYGGTSILLAEVGHPLAKFVPLGSLNSKEN
ncbi:uncharacterized protein FA14DRAFT_188666 [Meira miltonrushii]|uniref:Uncharacterized protein n=1 Tax=Meira miltonrushii TaxID=1280837 RepID=A0A316VGG8_9BASI|nr:uncharacterized protein FA14DRAFT_188666 [Meira miltonrushii]PWN34585.1 hypothetical protein FA14DRAFT_188666 [Meira miltonrushii]